ncbi:MULTISPECIES: FtsX-like permease family protein [Okeania]|uniref:FtsX-like permease family protein n=1 Tax=Okeania hirsuta TaxID=1458930 RepID=A0A3N6NUC9_9CYAN|nr:MULTISPECIES: FtsX-like permease family protein [Okeania]NES76633.1 FtsX-like permease family protein [Okeania sp. SIO1H4]NES91542.1 FtsX-like permease family protein [Okeania sp. SIO2B9]NET20264.1 FtsX-like permease family protein [Okeania sp. SIO1H5]NET80142.1 FtsX-like permease family protein [Okeania sp. SIO1F9]NET94483.1 FtsX-like permease family protein [Okeania sp. SIO1H2]
MASIARKNLLEDIPRFIVAQAGILFAVSLVTIQTGILNGFARSTTLLIDKSNADIWIASNEMVNFELTDPLLYGQLNQAKTIEGVQRAEALILGSVRWRPQNGEMSPLMVVGFNPDGQLFNPGKVIEGNVRDLKQPFSVMADQSRLSSMLAEGVGTMAIAGSLPAKLVAVTKGTQSIVSSTLLFTSLENANTYISAGINAEVNCKVVGAGNLQCTKVVEKKDPTQKLEETPAPKNLEVADPIAYILVKAKPGEDLQVLKQKIEEAMPATNAYTKNELSEKTRFFWLARTNIGLVLGMGAVVGVIVGIVVVAQILYSSVSDHLKEFGTLKAMGASDQELYAVIVEQAIWMAVLGYLPGMLVCLGLSTWVASKGIIILITPLSALGVLGITVFMCVGSAFFAIQKVTRIDPAIVFKA